ncbi:MAG: hypothetical protein CSA24_00925 [Deltaproteobacteria bacterium]|nr:MAG: hypothetical protein CSA24_00925 [Deltaproteobacteria bacterium]
MTRWHHLSRTIGAATFALLIAACNGGNIPFNPGTGTGTGTGNGDQPCTDPLTCCAPEDMVCTGNPDDGVICTCEGLWDCSVNPNKCSQDAPTPPGGGDWNCTWTEFVYTCEKRGEKGDPPPGGNGWNCTWNASESKWKCTKDKTPNPTNKPGGTNEWTCVVQNGKLICDRKNGKDQPPKGGGSWDCKDPTTGKPCTPGSGSGCVCTKTDEGGGLPPGGNNWKCNKVNLGGKLTWVCYGEVPPGGTPPGGNGWDCKKVGTQNGKELWKCVKGEEPGDQPPGGGHFSCAKGTEFNGTKCEEVEKPPTPPTPYPTPGEKCVPGTQMWCDGLQYCGWGQVTCQPDGSWPTKTVNGKQIIDCKELSNGARPNTVCACYHFYFNPACCERPDCLVPQGSQGQICPQSAGKLCDYCNPQKPECKETGGYCLVTNTMETFCGKGCTINGDCPKDYKCVKIKNKANKQCIPSDYSCYY